MGAPGLRGRWTTAFCVGELVGFLPPAITGAVLAAAGAPDSVLIVGLTAAGSVEGAVLGVAQARVLRDELPQLRSSEWVAATAAGAGFAWLVGMTGGALMGSDVVPPAVLAALLPPAWVAALLAMPYLQWRVLRHAVPRAGRWVWVNAGAWLVGVAIPMVTLTAWPNGWPVWSRAIAAVASAVVMGVTVGALTGTTLDRLLAPATHTELDAMDVPAMRP
jgi:hypothetical protein